MKISDAAKHLGVAIGTLRKWDRQGIISSDRSPLGHRLFTPEKILEIQKIIQNRSQERRRP